MFSFLLKKQQLETCGCNVATNALVLKHQAISIRSADWIFIVLDMSLKITHLKLQLLLPRANELTECYFIIIFIIIAFAFYFLFQNYLSL